MLIRISVYAYSSETTAALCLPKANIVARHLFQSKPIALVHLPLAILQQGCGSATSFRDCST